MSREKSRSTSATSSSTSSPCWWPYSSLISLKWSRSSITSASGVPKRRLRSTSRSRIVCNARTLARPVSSSVTAWRSTVSCRRAFSIDTTACPARYCSSSSSSRVNGRRCRAIESTPRYSGDPGSPSIGTASAFVAPPLGGAHRLVELRVVAALAALLERVRADRLGAPCLGLAGVHRGPHGERDHAVAVEPHGERVADAPDRLGQLPALALDLIDLRGELLGHAVELAPELAELVVSLDRNRLTEV